MKCCDNRLLAYACNITTKQIPKKSSINVQTSRCTSIAELTGSTFVEACRATVARDWGGGGGGGGGGVGGEGTPKGKKKKGGGN